MSSADAVPALEGVRFKGSIMVVEEPPQGMITMRAALDLPEVGNAIGTVPAMRQVAEGTTGPVLWMSPDELLLLCPYAEAGETLTKVQAAMAGTHHLAADVSDARAMFTLTGDGVREVMAKLTPADMSPKALPVLELRRTRLSQVACAFWFSDDETLHLICFRSVARYVFDTLKAAADTQAEIRFF